MQVDTTTSITTADEIAARLGWSRAYFLSRRARLEADGFPAMLPGRFGRWSRAAVDGWFLNHEEIKRIAGANRNQPVRIAWDRQRLTELYAGGAA